MTVRSDPDRPGYGTAVLDEGQVDASLETIAGVGSQAATLRIPTGVSIQSIEFLSANNVVVTGQVWQKYPDDLPGDFVRGIILPQAVAEEQRATETYRQDGTGYELVGWDLQATFRQGFDYRLYPFDHLDVRVLVASADRRPGIVLTPDFASYPAWEPSTLPGVEPNFVGDGWRLKHSVFSYASSPATSTFGRSDGLSAARPDLYFNVGLQLRSFDVLVNRLILLSVSLLIMFGIVLATERTPQGVNRYDLSVARTLGLGAALLFVLVLDYGQFRSMLRPEGLTYLGYAYLVIVLGLSLAIVNGVLYASGKHRIRLIEYEDNAIPNLLFAPILLSVFLVITLLLFYGA